MTAPAPRSQPSPRGVTVGKVWLVALVCALFAAVAASAGTWYWLHDATSTTANSGTGQADYTKVQSGQNTPVVPTLSADAVPDWATVAQRVRPTVVAIQAELSASEGSQGSGVIINSQQGYIVTNNHVVADARSIQVIMADGRLLSATALGTDPSTDLAVLALDNPPDDLQEASFGDSSKVQVGDPVMAVGNPLGLDNTVTTGIVSALNRPVRTSQAGSSVAPGEEVLTNAIQVDAAINPGNSGGPLFNQAGQVIGINSAIATLSSTGDQAGSIGLGFAIPVNLVGHIASQLVENGVAVHPLLGVSTDGSAAEVDGQLRAGAVIERVTPGSPADQAGLKVGDLIFGVDGMPITDEISLTATIRSYQPGATVKLLVSRDGQRIEITATLTTREG